MRKVTKKWITQDGRKIRICDMTDSHLVNTIRFLRGRAEVKRLAYSLHAPPFNEDTMAGFQAEQALDQMAGQTTDELAAEFWPIFDDLMTEAFRRNLQTGEGT